MSSTWTAAKTVGDVGEEIVARVLRGIGLLVQQHRGASPHDLSVSGAIEVKVDRVASSSGNLAVEISYNGNASGISTSTATAWAFVVGNEIIFVSTGDLRILTDEIEHPRVSAGEGAIVALIPVASVRRIGRSISIAGGVR